MLGPYDCNGHNAMASHLNGIAVSLPPNGQDVLRVKSRSLREDVNGSFLTRDTADGDWMLRVTWSYV